MEAPKTASKKRPGRPPVRPPAPAIERRGCVSAPADAFNRLEFVYDNPRIFKALFTFFKNLNGRGIHLRCNPRGLTFFVRDHERTTRVVAAIEGSLVNWYWCSGEFLLFINREAVEKIFSSIDKSFCKITLIQTIEDPSTINIIFRDAALAKDCDYKICLPEYAPDEELYAAEKGLDDESIAAGFPISFCLSTAQFKKSMSDSSNYSDKISIEKLGSEPLQLNCARSCIQYNEVYREPGRIRLRTTLDSSTDFRCTLKLSNVKSFAGAMAAAKQINLYCREDGDLLIRTKFRSNDDDDDEDGTLSDVLTVSTLIALS